MFFSGFVAFCPVLYVFCSRAFLCINVYPLQYLYDDTHFILLCEIPALPKNRFKRFCPQKPIGIWYVAYGVDKIGLSNN